ncbi:MAG TPA: MFS transporter [Candidatus Dormibacteraeota bacterium]|nr:MFS transporter [Candidatus Dormibacteraeota bacterium]
MTVNPHAYRVLLKDRGARRLLSGLGVSAIGDSMSTVTIAWLAVLTAPPGKLGLYVGLSIAAYTLPGAAGAFAFERILRHRPARALVLAHCLLRAAFLSTVALLAVIQELSPAAYVALLAGSSILTSWGTAGQYTLLAEVGGADGRLTANSLTSAQMWLATILGPAVAGLLLTRLAPGWLLAFDAASFAFLGLQAWRTRTDAETAAQPVDSRAAESGFSLLRRNHLLGLIALTWLFFFIYGPVEDAIPVYVAHDLHADARLLGAYWTSFGVGALASTLLTGMLRVQASRRIVLLIVAGWGACLVPFAFAPTGVTLICFAAGGLVYGPFVPLTYALFQSITTTANLPKVLAARSAALLVSDPLGTAIGGPIVGAIGARWTLTASGAATVLLAAVATVTWQRGRSLVRAEELSAPRADEPI